MSNIVLIGMPGAGKSTVGSLLAKSKGMTFVDTDALIREREGKSLQEIVDEYGMAKFLDLEEEIVCGIDVENSVIATGGSVVYSERSLEHLRGKGTVVYLKASYDDINKRLRNFNSRGMIIRKGNTLLDIYNERVPLYKKHAHVVVDCTGKNIYETVGKVKRIKSCS